MKLALRLVGLLLLALLGLQLYFAGRIVLMRWVDPQSTSFQRAEAHRLVRTTGQLLWRQEWLPYDKISDQLKRAVIASEDASFTEHDGVDLEALEKAWEKNQKAEQAAARTAKVEILVAELERNGIQPRSMGPGADVALLQRQIAVGKSAAATSGAPWL